MKSELYISVDIEASGPIPGEYSMLSLGACVISDISKTFYVELKPINDNYIQRAVEVSKLSINELKIKGIEPAISMKDFEDWITRVCESKSNRPVFVAFNATFDWSFVNYYFHKFLGRNPFGISGLDIKAYYMGMKKCLWADTIKKKVRSDFPSKTKHTHHALDDAIEQAEIFEKMIATR